MFVLSFLDINEDTGESFSQAWPVTDPEVEGLLRHIANEHLGPPEVAATGEEVRAGVREIFNKEK